MRRLDMVGRATEKQVHVYHIQNRPAVELAQLLQRIYGSQEQGRVASLHAHDDGNAVVGTAAGCGFWPTAFLPEPQAYRSATAAPAAAGLPVTTPAPAPDLGQPGAPPISGRPPLAAALVDDRTAGGVGGCR